MKIFVKLMALLVVLAVAGPLFLKGPDGRPLMTLRDIKWPSFSVPGTPLSGSGEEPALPSGPDAHIEWSKDAQQKRTSIKPDGSQPVVARENIYYRWRDHNGVWQFTKTPNPQAENFVVSVDTNANVVQALSAEKIDEVFGRNKKLPIETAEGGETQPKLSPLPSTIPLEEIPKLIEQAKGLQELADQRNKILEKGL